MLAPGCLGIARDVQGVGWALGVFVPGSGQEVDCCLLFVQLFMQKKVVVVQGNASIYIKQTDVNSNE